eukprot:938224-Lingulodinium_polyedra.AAC.1
MHAQQYATIAQQCTNNNTQQCTPIHNNAHNSTQRCAIDNTQTQYTSIHKQPYATIQHNNTTQQHTAIRNATHNNTPQYTTIHPETLDPNTRWHLLLMV